MRGLKHLFQKRRSISIKTLTLSISLFLFTLVIVVVSMLSYRTTAKFVLDNMEKMNLSEQEQISKKFELYMKEVGSITGSIARSPELLEKLKMAQEERGQSFEKLKLRDEIEMVLLNYKTGNQSINSIILLTDDMVFTSGETTLYNIKHKDITRNNELYEALMRSESPVLLDVDSGLAVKEVIPNVYNSTDIFRNKMSYGCLVKEKDTEYGSVFVLVSGTWINSFFDKNIKAAIFNGEGKTVWCSDAFHENKLKELSDYRNHKEQKQVELNGEKYNVFYTNTALNSWKIAYLKNVNEIEDQLAIFKNTIILFIALSIVLAVLLSKVLLNNAYKSFEVLVNKSMQYRKSSDGIDALAHFNRRNPVTMREKIMYYLIAVVLTPLLLFMVLYHFSSTHIVENEMKRSVYASFKRTKGNVETLIKQQEKMIRNVVFDRNIQKYIENYEEEVDNLFLHEIKKRMNDKMEMGQYYAHLEMYGADENFLFSNTDGSESKADQKTFDRLEASGGEALWSDPVKDRYGRWYINLMLKIKNLRTGSLMKTIGYAVAGIEEIYLEQVYKSSVIEGVEIVILNNRGTVISGRDKNIIGAYWDLDIDKGKQRSNVANGMNNIITVREGKSTFLLINESLLDTSWSLAEKYDYSKIEAEGRKLVLINIYIMVLLTLFIIVVSYFISFIFIRPLNEFNFLLGRIKLDNLSPAFPKEHFISEIEELGATYNDMVVRIESLIDEVLMARMAKADLEQEKKELEQIVLQAQVNPHFLCNTLECIKWTIEDDREKAVRMINSLNNLFKYGISRTESIITIEQEIKYAKSYVDIIKLRYTRKIDFLWDIDENVLQYMTIKLILQPLIENAIYHGYEDKSINGAAIAINCYEREDEIFFCVNDNGKGINEKKLEEVQSNLDNPELTESIGLSNVNRRVRLYFGLRYGVKISSKAGKGTIVEINIPKIKSF